MIIKNGRIHIGNGKVLEDHDILIKDGLIEKVGKDLNMPGVDIIDGKNTEIFPGFIDPVSSYGCMDTSYDPKDHDEISNPITPDAKIRYAFDFSEILYEELYKVGITTIGAAPGDKNIIGGQMAVYKTWGKNSGQMLVREPVGLKGSVTHSVKEVYGKRNTLPMTRMGIFSELERFLEENTKKTKVEAKDSIVPKVLNGEIPLFITAKTAPEINALIHVMENYDVNLVICGGYQADRCIEDIMERNISIVVGEQTDLTVKNYNDTDLYKIAKLQEEGGLVSFSLTSGYGPEGKIKYLWNGIEFYKAGVESEDVVKMMTFNPAKILGVEDILGTIEEGKVADIVIYSNNPIEYYNSKVLYTIVNGEIVYQERGEKQCC